MSSFFVIDDSNVARRFIKKMLVDLKHEVVCEASDGKNALSIYVKERPDFITIDMEMPIIDGITVAHTLRKADKNAKIIMITSIVDKKRTIQALNSGVDIVLLKPITTKQLEQAINSLK